MLTIVNVAFPFATVEPSSVGGAEQVVSALDRALCVAGHRSLVIARRGSRTLGELVPVEVPHITVTPELRGEIAGAYRRALASLISSTRVDLLHFHGVDCAEYLPEAGPHKLVTLHLDEMSRSRGLLSRSDLLFTCVSQTQRERIGHGIPVEATVPNGVDLEFFRPLADPLRNYAACLGRVCPEKGYDSALRAAHATGLALRVAGLVFPYSEHQRYFAESICPLLDERRQFVGPVADGERRSFLAHAACLIVPSRVAETSSLVTMEALACGTPVIVSDQGALPSLIEPGVTGFVAPNEHALSDALLRVPTLSREACRKSAEARFDLARTVTKYLDLYQRICRLRPFEEQPVRGAVA